MKTTLSQPPVRIVVLYALLAGGWIAVSDHFVAQLALSPAARERLSMLKGWAFVAVTALLLFGLLRREFAAHRKTETALREQENRLRLAVAASNVGLWDWDLQTNQVYFSPEWKRQLGYAEDEISNAFSEWESRVHPDDREPVLQKVRAYLAHPQGAHEVEFRLRHKDGSYRWIYTHAEALCDAAGRPVRMLGCHVDITARKQAEVALRQAHEQLAQIVATTPGIVCAFRLRPDGSSCFPFGGERLAAYYGIPGARLAENAAPFFALVHPDDLGTLREAIAESASRLAPFRHEWRIRHPERGELWIEAHSMPAREPDGSTVWHGVATDITARKQAEAALRRSQEQLRALARRLQSAREEESRRIARELHDELGQMLTGLKLDLRSLERDLEAAPPEARVNRWLEKLLAASELVDTAIRAVQRLSAELRPAPLDKLGLPASLRQEVRQFEERTGTVCRLRLPEADSPLPDAAATALYRIGQEALTNVARHAGATEVEVELRAAPDAWELEVRDNGRGIAPEQLNDPHSLGLVGMRERAAQFGGELDLLPRPGGGTVVRARIPRAAPDGIPERSSA
jgi:PAS domain S-box-containing protein